MKPLATSKAGKDGAAGLTDNLLHILRTTWAGEVAKLPQADRLDAAKRRQLCLTWLTHVRVGLTTSAEIDLVDWLIARIVSEAEGFERFERYNGARPGRWGARSGRLGERR